MAGKDALWVRRHIEKTPDAATRLDRGFEEMPEVLELLDLHLDPPRDPSRAIRSVYGQWFPWLVLLDPTWAASRVERIFPRSPDHVHLRDAAWETYIGFCNPYDKPFEVLREEYGRAIDRIGVNLQDGRYLPEEQSLYRPFAASDKSLAEHLMTFYWRGKVDLHEASGLLHRFYAKASPALCAHAADFVGRSLRDTVGEVPAPVLERLRLLWERRVEAARDAPGTDSKPELAAFGEWFASGKFTDDWSFARLRQVFDLAGRIDAGHLVAERLAKMAPGRPLDAVEALAKLVESDLEGWSIHGWLDEARAVLSAALDGEDKKARRAATELVHRLGALGHLSFRDLLPKQAQGFPEK